MEDLCIVLYEAWVSKCPCLQCGVGGLIPCPRRTPVASPVRGAEHIPIVADLRFPHLARERARLSLGAAVDERHVVGTFHPIYKQWVCRIGWPGNCSSWVISQVWEAVTISAIGPPHDHWSSSRRDCTTRE